MKGRGYRHTPQTCSLRTWNEGTRSRTANAMDLKGKRGGKILNLVVLTILPVMRRSFRVCVRFGLRWLKHHSCRDAAAVSSVVDGVHAEDKTKNPGTRMQTGSRRSQHEQQLGWDCSFRALSILAKSFSLPRSSPGRGPPASLRRRYSTSSSPFQNLHFVQSQSL